MSQKRILPLSLSLVLGLLAALALLSGAAQASQPPPPETERGATLPAQPDFSRPQGNQIEEYQVSLFFDDMEGASNWAASGLWHPITDTHPSGYGNSYSPVTAWWYGQNSTGDFNNGSTNSGTITLTTPISLPVGLPEIKLSFWSWEQTECGGGCYYDRRIVEVAADSPSPVWITLWNTQFDPSIENAWHEVELDLSAFAGQNILLRFSFATLDAVANDYRGWYVDDLSIGYDRILLEPEQQFSGDTPGETVEYVLSLTNNMLYSDSFDLSITHSDWPAAITPTTALLNTGETAYITVTVDIPAGANLGDSALTHLLASSVLSPTLVTDTASIRTTALSGQYGYIFTPDDDSIKVVDTILHMDTGILIEAPDGSWPWRGALSPDGSWLYASLRENDTILGIDTASNTVAFSLTVGDKPHGIAFSSDGAYALVANSNDNTVSVIDTSVPTVTATIPVGSEPYSIAVIPCGNKAYVTNRDDNSVSVINLNTLTVTQVISGFYNPWDIVISPYGYRAYVSGEESVGVIDTIHDTFVVSRTIGGEEFSGMDISPDGEFIYVAGPNSGQTYVINASTGEVVNWLDTSESQAWEVEFFPAAAGPYAYVTSVEDNTVQVIDTTNHTILSEIPLSGEPRGLALFPPETACLTGVLLQPNEQVKAATPGQTLVFTETLFNLTGGPASFDLQIDAGPWTTTLSDNSTGVMPYGGRFVVNVSVEVPASAQVGDFQHNLLEAVSVANPDDQAQAALTSAVPRPGYIFNTDDNVIHVVDTQFHFDTGIVITTPVDSFPWRGALTPDGSQLYISLRYSDTLMIVDTANLDGPHPIVPVGNEPQGIAFNPDGSLAYVALTDGNALAVFDTQNLTVTAAISITEEPFNVATSPCLPDKIYVTSRDGGALTVIDANTLTVTQVITGLGGAWDVVISPLGDRVYVSNAYSGTIAVIDTATDALLATWEITNIDDPQLQGMDISPSGKVLYATDNENGATYAIDTASGSVLAQMRTGPDESAWEVETFAWPYGDTAYVTGPWDQLVAVLDTQSNQVVGAIAFPGEVRGLALFPPESVCSVAPSAAFTPTYFTVTVGMPITFTNLSSGIPDPIYTWNFGDGNFSLETNPIHTFNTPGEYTVILTATNPIDQDAAYGIITVKSIYQQIFLPTIQRH